MGAVVPVLALLCGAVYVLALRALDDEALALEPVRLDVLSGPAAAWGELRASRSNAAASAFHGQGLSAARPSYPVRAVEEYVKCPFRYFAQHVLALSEEAGGEQGAAARARGLLLHEVLHAFYAGWQQAGGGAITARTIDDARDGFRALVDARLAAVPVRDRALLAMRLLGSPFAPGVIDTIGRFEIERDLPVVERLLEVRLDGPCVVRGEAAARTLRVVGVADRIDLLADGSFDVVDYKLGRAPNLRHTVQLPLYAAHATTVLAGRHGRDWRLRDAAYLAFAGSDHVVSLGRQGRGVDQSVAAGQQRFLAAVEGIEAGRFPPRPADVTYCTTCAFAAVCRKDYVHGD